MTEKKTGSDFNKIQVYISSYFKILEIVSEDLDLGSLETETQAPLSMGFSRQEYWSG